MVSSVVSRFTASRAIFSYPDQLREAYERAKVPKHAYAKGPRVMEIRALAAHMADRHAERGLVLVPQNGRPCLLGLIELAPTARLRH